MAEFKWIKMSLFGILLQFTAVTGRYFSFTVRDGDDVILTCENVVDGQVNCDTTNWFITGSGSNEVDLVTGGQIVERDKVKPDRLSVTENCSLVIKKVAVQDAGVYLCQQLKPGQQVADTQIQLSVINMKEHEDGERMELSCTVSTRVECIHTVRWLFEGNDADGDIRYTDMQTSHSECSVTVIFPISNLKLKSKYHELFKCEVKDHYNGKEQPFPFFPQSSGEDAATSTTMRTTESSKKPRITSTTPAVSVPSALPQVLPVWCPYLIAVIALVALVIITVAVVRWKMTKGEKRQTDDNAGQSLTSALTEPGPETSQDTADPEDGVSYASISYTKKTNSRAQVRVRNDDDDEGDSVTYSSVKASSSRAGASADPSDLYAAVNKVNK